MRVFTLFVSFFSIIVTALPLIQTDEWWVRIWDFPRAQVAVVAVISIALVVVYLRKNRIAAIVLGILLLTAFIYQASLIYKYTPLYPIQARSAINPDPQNSFSILQSNVKMDNDNYEEYKNLVIKYDPDVILVNEPDQRWADEIKELDEKYPHYLKHPLDNTYGMILYSKFPFKESEINFLVEDSIPSMFATLVLPSGEEVNLHCLHPEPPQPGTDTYERDTEILLVGKRVREENKPAIVVGDLNDVAWSYTSELFQEYSQLLDPREGRGLYNTYNAFIPLFRYPLDHFFYSGEFALISLSKLDKFGSDHFPMLLEVEFQSDNENYNIKSFKSYNQNKNLK
jgi:endonuclease/exonuclease/phosphatase (EEP) superfamily protein YafD